MDLISEGAEAKVYSEGNSVIKERVSKNYRHPKIDSQIISSRTRLEAKIIDKLKSFDCAPKLISVSENEITMQKVEGEELNSAIADNKISVEDAANNVARILFLLHSKNVIHGDVTPKNFILDNNSKLFVIDFGLSVISTREEDKAYDIAMCKETFSLYPEFYESLEQSYLKLFDDDKKKETFEERLQLIFSRGRNKKKN